uniref:6-phosphogluconolactonase n=1 Tax=Hucho hucho TaxID=62062 RepID=A0A4W5Q686_9TELE
MSGRRVVLFSSAAELGPALAHLVASRADKALLDHGRFSLALPDLDCSHWLAGFCDERLVPFDDGESTYGLYKNQLFSKINIPDSGVLAIVPSLSVQECAEDYARKLTEVHTHTVNLSLVWISVFVCCCWTWGLMDTCSLFPDHPLLEVSIVYSPVSGCLYCTVASFHVDSQVVFCCSCVALIIKSHNGGEGPALPAARVVPSHGELFWLTDEPAAASLTLHETLDCLHISCRTVLNVCIMMGKPSEVVAG